MSRDIFCRPRQESDSAALTDLWVSSWQKAMPQIDFEARRAWFPAHLAGLEAAGFQTIVAAGHEELLGFVTLHPQRQALDQLAVAAKAWGSGAAKLLLDEARRLSPQGLVLDVNCDNPRAIAFYRREGFEQAGEGTNPSSGLKTWRMRWQP